jgi:hypothetical protein
MARDSDEDAIRIAWIDGNLRDLLPIAQSQMRPGLARIG